MKEVNNKRLKTNICYITTRVNNISPVIIYNRRFQDSLNLFSVNIRFNTYFENKRVLDEYIHNSKKCLVNVDITPLLLNVGISQFTLLGNSTCSKFSELIHKFENVFQQGIISGILHNLVTSNNDISRISRSSEPAISIKCYVEHCCHPHNFFVTYGDKLTNLLRLVSSGINSSSELNSRAISSHKILFKLENSILSLLRQKLYSIFLAEYFLYNFMPVSKLVLDKLDWGSILLVSDNTIICTTTRGVETALLEEAKGKMRKKLISKRVWDKLKRRIYGKLVEKFDNLYNNLDIIGNCENNLFSIFKELRSLSRNDFIEYFIKRII